MSELKPIAQRADWLDGLTGVRRLYEARDTHDGDLVYVTGIDSEGRQVTAWISADSWAKWKGATK